jgi:FtsP/CotA-like multicopper oxidase with cupredoxin domain
LFPGAGLFQGWVASRRSNSTSSPTNPGPTLFHCHQQVHMDFGFMALFGYA